jgi:hypothetical protein
MRFFANFKLNKISPTLILILTLIINFNNSLKLSNSLKISLTAKDAPVMDYNVMIPVEFEAPEKYNKLFS